MIIVITDGVAGVSVLINFTCNVKLWEIAIMLDDSGDISKDLDGSAVFMKPLPPPGGRLPSSSPELLLLSPHCSAEVTGSVCLSLSFVSCLCSSVWEGLSPAGTKSNKVNRSGENGGPSTQIQNPARVKRQRHAMECMCLWKSFRSGSPPTPTQQS